MTTKAELETIIAGATAKVGLTLRAVLTEAIPTTPDTQPQIVQTIDAFTRAPPVIKVGESAELLWHTSNATAVRINGELVAASGSKTVAPTTDAAYTLVAKRDGVPDVSATVAVTVIPVAVEPAADLLPSRASDGGSLHLNWMEDLIHVKDLPPTPPYTRNLKFPSQNGVQPERWDSGCPWGNQLHLYDGTQTFKDGRIVLRDTATNPHHSDVLQHAARMLADPPVVGARGVGYVDPIATSHGHPADSVIGWFQIRADNALVALYWDGTSAVLGWIKGAVAPLDFSYTDTGKVLLTASQDGRIIRTDRTKALDNAKASGKPENSEEWEHTDLVSGIGRATGVRFTPWGIFACGGGNVVKIEADGTWSVFVAGISAFGIDYMDTKLTILTSDRTRVLLVDPVTAQVTPALADGGVALEFGTIEVDRPGHIGPKNSIYFSRTQGANNSNETFVLYEGKDFSAAPFFDAHPSNGRAGGWLSVGDTAYMPELYHYPWALSPHPIFACALLQGTGNLFPRLLFPQQPDRPAMAPYDNDLFRMGLAIHAVGCYRQENAGTVPSFDAQMNLSYWSNIGISADAIVAEMGTPPDYDRLRARIQNGLWGSFKRPDIVGYGLRGYGYSIIESSMQYQAIGAPLIEGWLAWCDVHAPGVPGPIPTAPSGPKLPPVIVEPEPDPVHVPPVVAVGDPVPGLLRDKFAAMTPGTWDEIKPANINTSLRDPTSKNTQLVMHYSCAGVCVVVDGVITIVFIGMDHGVAAPCGFSRYSDAAGRWEDRLPCYGLHGYNMTLTDGARIFRIITSGDFSSTYAWAAPQGLYLWDEATKAMQPFALLPESFSQSDIAGAAGAWWSGPLPPGVGGPKGAAILYSGNSGAIYLLNEATKDLPPSQAWTAIPDAMPGQRGEYQNIGAYSERFNCYVYGGGNLSNGGSSVLNQVWRLNADLSTTRLADAPHRIGIEHGMICAAGPDGFIYFYGFGEFWRLDPRLATPDAWAKMAIPPAWALYPNDMQAVFITGTPGGIVITQGAAANGELDCRMAVYKPPLEVAGTR